MPASFRLLSFVFGAWALLFSPLGRAQQPTPAAAPGSTTSTPAHAPDSALTSSKTASNKMIAEGVKQMYANNADSALSDLSQAIKLNPDSRDAYFFRGSIYFQKKLYAQAEADFKSASAIAPKDVLAKINLAEIKFVQKQYDAARANFAALQKDPDMLKNAPEMIDFAAYKVFLCDLFGGHDAAAKKEFNVLNGSMENPSYEFSNAAWALVHKNLDGDDGARYWLLRASRVYPPEKNAVYAQSLRDLGYLPIPEATDKVTPPGAGAPLPK